MSNGNPTTRELGAVTQQHGRDIVTLREYEDEKIENLKSSINERFEASKEAVQAALSAAKEAVIKAELASEKRFESINEFRGQLADQASTLMPRAETEIRLKGITERIEVIDKSVVRSEGRNNGFQLSWGIFLAVASLIAYVAFNLGHK